MDKGRAVPPALLLTSMLSASTTVVLSVSYTILSILGLVYRFNCDVTSEENTSGSDHFMNMILRVYIQSDSECESSPTWADGLTSADSVFVLNIITLSASALTLIAALALITVVQMEDGFRYLHITVYIYVGVWFVSLVVDLTYATHFGMDSTYVTDQMDLSNPGLPLNYDRDMVRLGALLLMAITLKGFVIHAMQLVLVILLLIHAVDFQQQTQKEQHSIHKLGALNAYDGPRRQESWQPDPPMFLGQNRGTHTNPAFVEDSPPPPRRSMRREPSVPDYNNSRDISRSESWQPSMLSGRPFSYLEEAKKPAVAPRPVSPAEPQWRRGEWAPPVPAPDYSPQTPRRLKSALKPSYM